MMISTLISVVGPIFPYEPQKVNITQPGTLYTRQDSFTVTSKMSPAAKLLVYYIRPDKEVVADSISFDVQPVFDNKVRAEQLNNLFYTHFAHRFDSNR